MKLQINGNNPDFILEEYTAVEQGQKKQRIRIKRTKFNSSFLTDLISKRRQVFQGSFDVTKEEFEMGSKIAYKPIILKSGNNLVPRTKKHKIVKSLRYW